MPLLPSISSLSSAPQEAFPDILDEENASSQELVLFPHSILSSHWNLLLVPTSHSTGTMEGTGFVLSKDFAL